MLINFIILMESKLNISVFQNNLITYPNIDELVKLDFSENFKEILTRFKNITADIFACHSFFNEFPNNTFLKNLLDNLLANKFTSLDEILNSTTKLITETTFAKEEIFLSLIILYYIYLQESAYGPSFFFIKETEKVDFSKDIHKFDNHALFKLEENVSEIKEQVLNYFTLAGETSYAYTKLLLFNIIPYEFIAKTETFDNYGITKLWKLRLFYQHQKLIREPTAELKDKVFTLMNEIDVKDFEGLNDAELIKGLLKLEFSYYYIRYYKYKESEEHVEEAKNLFGLKIALTGRLGKKTKYQEDERPILVVESESSTLNLNTEVKENPNTVKLDEDNPLLEVPDITDDTFLKSTELSLYDQIYINGLINYLKKSLPDEDILREIIVTYANKSMSKSFDWLVYSKILLNKCQAEDKRTKTIERCLLQIQSLCEQYNDRSPVPYERLKYYFAIDYPLIWNLKKIYAEAYMNFGAVMTAFEIFQEIEMYEECINCLYIAGKHQRAQEFADEVLKKKPDPGIYCILGEIHNKEECFLKALEISGNKYTRAYRCLGRYNFVQKK
jgi:hypothetical protein